MNPLISIIVPCYNVESYLDRCLDSLVHQTLGLERLEMILVNDASTDATYEKLCDWERQYPDHIMVVNCEENGRQGTARNIGISYAGGDISCLSMRMTGLSPICAGSWSKKPLYIRQMS